MKEVLEQNRLIKIKDLRANKGQLVDKGIPKNPRKITKEKYNLLLQSLDKSNLTQIRPLDVIEHEGKYVVLSGNQRLRALKELKIKEVPCNILRDDLEPETYRQIVLQANTNYGEHDDDLLANEWDAVELHEWGYDLPSWDEEKIEQEETQGDDDVPESAPAITVKGDLYTLGEHRLLCGDSTMIDDVEKLMDGEKADMVFTDPPYGVNYEGGIGRYEGGVIKGKMRLKIKNDDKVNLYKKINPIINHCIDEGAIYVWYADKFIKQVLDVIEGFELRGIINWYKINQGFGDMGANYHSVSEPCLYLVKGKSNFVGGNNEKNIWEIQRPNKNILHPTQKPIELAFKAIKNSSVENGNVLDLFLGSGSTLIACEKTKRKCYGMELDEKYCDVIVKRYIEFCFKNSREAKVYRNGDLISNDVFLVESEGKS